jgi:glutamine synthetase
MIYRTILEYIWLGGNGEIRSKTKTVPHRDVYNIEDIDEWNFDGSSTGQANSDGDTEVIIKPCSLYIDPLRKSETVDAYIVLCDTYKPNGDPHKTNNRYKANILFDNLLEERSWFGLEQEYFMFKRYDPLYRHGLRQQLKLYGYNDGTHYCGTTTTDLERTITEQHMQMCIEAKINISGINAEVENNQWEFQIGPSEGINAADDLIIARYLLERIAERFDVAICYTPKPFRDTNGSGCHINFSTVGTRANNGIEVIHEYIRKLEQNHSDHIAVYGNENDKRLTGLNETSSIDEFTWGVGTRNTSIRIPNIVKNAGCGYFEDRRPAANIDPYLATSKLFETCCSDTFTC